MYDFQKRKMEFDKRFKQAEKIFWIFFWTVFAIVVFGFIVHGVLTLYLLAHPEGVGEWFGDLIEGFQRSQ